MTKTTQRNLVDLVERATATFAQAFLAVALVTNLSDRHNVEIAGAAGALAVGKWVYSRVNAYLARPETPAQDPATKPSDVA